MRDLSIGFLGAGQMARALPRVSWRPASPRRIESSPAIRRNPPASNLRTHAPVPGWSRTWQPY